MRGRGAMLAVELVKPGTLDARPGCARRRWRAACHAAGLLVLTCGTYGNVLRFLPPLVISRGASCARGLDILAESLLAQLPG